MTIKSVGVFSVGKIAAILQGVIGLLIGVVFALVGMAGAMAPEIPNAGGAFMPLMFGGGALILFPLMYALMGFIFGVVGALVYNAVASIVGGIELVVE